MAERRCGVNGCDRPYYAKGYCRPHYRRVNDGAAISLDAPIQIKRGDRSPAFWAQVNKDGPVPEHRPDLGPCWLWTGNLTRQGYGLFKIKGQNQSAHVLAYEWLVGPRDPELVLDHVCHSRSVCPGGPSCYHRSCVNPPHLEQVTFDENMRRSRKTRCIRDHLMEGDNLLPTRDGYRCRQCNTERAAEWAAKNRRSAPIG